MRRRRAPVGDHDVEIAVAVDIADLQVAGAGELLGQVRAEAVGIDPTEIMSQTVLGDSAAALGQKEEARKAWEAALVGARQLEPDAQMSYVPDLEEKLKAAKGCAIATSSIKTRWPTTGPRRRCCGRCT